MTRDAFLVDGYITFPADPRVAAWAQAAREAGAAVVADADQRARWLRHGGTWFVGVDALPNEPDGSIRGVPLRGPWEDVVALPRPLHRAQLSIVYQGYPRRDPEDNDASHRFRVSRDSAHLDGLLPEGPEPRRHLRQPHRFILGLPLTEAGGSPLVVWPGSHEVIREALLAAYAGLPVARWPDTDVAAIYRAARSEVFETFERVELPLNPGQAVLLHRLLIHGIAPWAEGAAAGPEGRMAAYFRPVTDDLRAWLRDP